MQRVGLLCIENSFSTKAATASSDVWSRSSPYKNKQIAVNLCLDGEHPRNWSVTDALNCYILNDTHHFGQCLLGTLTVPSLNTI